MEYHRKYPRFNVSIESAFASETLAGQGTITNLSVGGCCIDSTIARPAQGAVVTQIHLPDSSWPLEFKKGIVRWARGNTFGLECQTLSEPDTTHLRQSLPNLNREPQGVPCHPEQ